MGGVADFAHDFGDAMAHGGYLTRDLLKGKPEAPTVMNPRTVTQAEKDRLLAEFDKTGGKSVTGDIFLGDNEGQVKTRLAQLRSDFDTSLLVPTAPVDPSNELIRKAMANERRKQASMSGTGSSALTGPSGLPSLPTLRPRAGGY